MKVPKKFYVAAQHIANGDDTWCYDTLEGAIAHAKALLEEYPERKQCYVVQTVRVVRRRKLPLEVLTVT